MVHLHGDVDYRLYEHSGIIMSYAWIKVNCVRHKITTHISVQVTFYTVYLAHTCYVHAECYTKLCRK